MIQADPATNSLIVTAPEPLYRNIRAIVDKLDVRRAQVVIESLIVEVTADKAAEFGIQWQALGGIDDSGTSVIGGVGSQWSRSWSSAHVGPSGCVTVTSLVGHGPVWPPSVPGSLRSPGWTAPD